MYAARALLTSHRDRDTALETLRGMLEDRRKSRDLRRVLDRVLTMGSAPTEAYLLVQRPADPVSTPDPTSSPSRLLRASGDVTPIRRADADPLKPENGK